MCWKDRAIEANNQAVATYEEAAENRKRTEFEERCALVRSKMLQIGIPEEDIARVIFVQDDEGAFNRAELDDVTFTMFYRDVFDNYLYLAEPCPEEGCLNWVRSYALVSPADLGAALSGVRGPHEHYFEDEPIETDSGTGTTSTLTEQDYTPTDADIEFLQGFQRFHTHLHEH